MALLTPSPSSPSVGVSADNRPRLGQNFSLKGTVLKLQAGRLSSARTRIACGREVRGLKTRVDASLPEQQVWLFGMN
jgi:hypothetical protein